MSRGKLKLLAAQMNNIELIKFWDNHKKLDRKDMSTDYLLARLNLLKEYWMEVLKNDGALHACELKKNILRSLDEL